MKRALRILSVFALKRATLRFHEAQLSINLRRHIYSKVFSTLKKRADNAKRLRAVGEQIELNRQKRLRLHSMQKWAMQWMTVEKCKR